MPQARAIFRCEAGGSTGLGHAVRSSAIAARLLQAGWDVAVAISDKGYAAVPDLAAFPRLCPEAALTAPADLFVLDGYHFDLDLERKFRKGGGKLLILDDAPIRPHEADYLLDSGFGRTAEDYAAVAPAARVLAGEAYAPVRPAFRRVRAEQKQRLLQMREAPVRRALVSLGGTDPLNHTGKVLAALAPYAPAIRFVVVMGPRADHLDRIRAETAAVPGAELHIAPPDMAALMGGCDLAIGAGGSSSWERCCLGLPTLALIIAENQRATTERLAAAGALRQTDVDPTRLTQDFAALLADAAARRTMTEAGQSLIDGRGLDRILLALWPKQPIRDGWVTFRVMEAQDEALLLEWQGYPETRRHARNPAPPTEAEHAAWYRKLLEDPQQLAFFIQEETAAGPRPVGYVRLSWREAPLSGWEFSNATIPSQYRRGIARAGLAFLAALVPRDRVFGYAVPENRASHRLIQESGFLPVGDGWYCLPPRMADSAAESRDARRLEPWT